MGGRALRSAQHPPEQGLYPGLLGEGASGLMPADDGDEEGLWLCM